jgi:quercetin dioxygenase-like cupin family protein
VQSSTAPHGPLHGEKYLASGRHIGLRLFDLEKGRHDDWHSRQYECVGYCIKGKARLSFQGGGGGGANKVVEIGPGTSYCVPEGVQHKWEILEDAQLVEGTSPVCFVHERDRPVTSSSY